MLVMAYYDYAILGSSDAGQKGLAEARSTAVEGRRQASCVRRVVEMITCMADVCHTLPMSAGHGAFFDCAVPAQRNERPRVDRA